jgi:ABC-2 type transport system ATP-binding protein
MRRRLQLAAIVIGRPALLVLDEPFAGLDAEGRAGLLKAIGDASHRGAGVLVAAHDLDLEALASLEPRQVVVGAGPGSD